MVRLTTLFTLWATAALAEPLTLLEPLTLAEAPRFHLDVRAVGEGRAFEVRLTPLAVGDPMEPSFLDTRLLMCIALPEPTLEQRLQEAAWAGATEYCQARFGVSAHGVDEPRIDGEAALVSGSCQPVGH